MDHLHIHMLGGFAIEDAQGRRIVVASRKTQALLAYLAYRPDRPPNLLHNLLNCDNIDSRRPTRQ